MSILAKPLLLKLTTCKDTFQGALCNNFLSQTPEVLKE